MVDDKIARVKADEDRVALTLLIINLGFAILSLGTSGAFSAAALLISATAGGIETIRLAEEYNQKHSAANIAHDQRLALTREYPELAW